MAAMNVDDGPSESVLEETPARVLKFLTGVANNHVVFLALAERGYSEDDQQEGWSLLHGVSGYRAPGAAPIPRTAAADALAEVDNWDEKNFRIARAALGRKHVPQRDFIFDNLEAGRGPDSLVAVTTFLDRLDVLESGKGRGKATQVADKQAVALLDKRGITPAVRDHLRKRIAEAKKVPAAAPPIGSATGAGADKREADLRALRAWFDDWSEVARVEIKRRDLLIRLGLASPRPRESAAAPGNNGGGKAPPA